MLNFLKSLFINNAKEKNGKVRNVGFFGDTYEDNILKNSYVKNLNIKDLDDSFFDKFNKYIEVSEYLGTKQDNKKYNLYLENFQTKYGYIVSYDLTLENDIFKESSLSNDNVSKYLSLYKDDILDFNCFKYADISYRGGNGNLDCNECKVLFNDILKCVRDIYLCNSANDKDLLKEIFKETIILDTEGNLKIYYSEYFPYFSVLIDKIRNSKNQISFDDDLSFEDMFNDGNEYYQLPSHGNDLYIPLFLELYDNDTLVKIKNYVDGFIYLRDKYRHFDIRNNIRLSDIFMIIDLDFNITCEEFILFKKYSSDYEVDKLIKK